MVSPLALSTSIMDPVESLAAMSEGPKDPTPDVVPRLDLSALSEAAPAPMSTMEAATELLKLHAGSEAAPQKAAAGGDNISAPAALTADGSACNLAGTVRSEYAHSDYRHTQQHVVRPRALLRSDHAYCFRRTTHSGAVGPRTQVWLDHANRGG